MHFALDGRDGQAEHVRIGAGEHRYLIRQTSATEHGPDSAGHEVQNAFVLPPVDR
ncbi:MAG: hypothetical protein ACRDP5_19195 [Streptosporangiaceae bacterium]